LLLEQNCPTVNVDTPMLSNDIIAKYLEPLTAEQQVSIQAFRRLLIAQAPSLVEQIDEGKWFVGLLTYSLPTGQFAFALGPRAHGFTTFHMMPYYESKALQERHGAALKKFLSGKSCIKFKNYADLPEESLADIIRVGTQETCVTGA
jgi:hypothetical protein